MNRIERIFAELRASGRKGLMPFICGGRPTPEATTRLLPALEGAGASIVEVGFPFSDPIADGPVIAAAMHEALGAGVTPRAVMEAVSKARGGVNLGVVAMVSVSIVHRWGADRFGAEAEGAGFDGVILPDVPVEEAEGVAAPLRDAGLTVSLLVAPTTSAERAERIVRACDGFVYLLARVGITGESSGPADVSKRVAMLRRMTDLPIACGFGIASAEHVRSVVIGGGADAAIVGTALVRRIEEAASRGGDAVGEASELVRGFASGLVAGR